MSLLHGKGGDCEQSCGSEENSRGVPGKYKMVGRAFLLGRQVGPLLTGGGAQTLVGAPERCGMLP